MVDIEPLMPYVKRVKDALQKRGIPNAEDLVQDVLLRIWRMPDDHIIKSPLGYMVRAAIRMHVETNKDDQLDPISIKELYAHAEEPEKYLMAVEEVEQRLHRTRRMTDRQREVYIRSNLLDQSYDEIAEHFAISASMVKRYVMDGKRRAGNGHEKGTPHIAGGRGYGVFGVYFGQSKPNVAAYTGEELRAIYTGRAATPRRKRRLRHSGSNKHKSPRSTQYTLECGDDACPIFASDGSIGYVRRPK